MITIEMLRNFGADTEEGLARCYNNEALYLKLIGMLPNEKNFDNLSAALAADDLDAAFEAAHALKGVLGNLSLTPMYEKSSQITELLRERTRMDYTPMLKELLDMKERLTAMIND